MDDYQDPASDIRIALQRLLDAIGDGWTVTQHVIAMGLERVVEGQIQATAWVWSPPAQPDWMTSGLLDQAVELRESTEDYE